MPNFRYYNIEIKKSHNKEIAVTGQIFNDTSKSYSTVGVRLILYVNNISVANVVFAINGLNSGSGKVFEKTIEQLSYDQIGKNINRYELTTETAF